jgi:glyoxylase-like metal-dependent hydrolase (beta-lactamase superfamily II)
MRDHRFPARRSRDHQSGPRPEGPAILLTHAHDDHIGAAREVADGVGAPIVLNPEDLVLLKQVYPDTEPDRHHDHGDVFEVGGVTLRAIHTPGHSRGSTCFYLESEGTVFTGDRLFNGGPGATARSYSDYPTILASIRERLLTLPPETVVRAGHGDDTSIGAERETLAKVSQ